GYQVPVVSGSPGPHRGDTIALVLAGDGAPEAYQLDVTAGGVTIRASRPAGLFAGVQTLRQLLPPAIESGHRRPGSWAVPGGHVSDAPRFAYRGAMLDVARHF